MNSTLIVVAGLAGMYAVPIAVAAAWPAIERIVQWLRIPLLTIAAVIAAVIALSVLVIVTFYAPPLTPAGAIIIGAFIIAGALQARN